MSNIPLHIQRQFEQRWASHAGSMVVPSAPKNVGSKGSPDAPCATRVKERPAGVNRRASTSEPPFTRPLALSSQNGAKARPPRPRRG